MGEERKVRLEDLTIGTQVCVQTESGGGRQGTVVEVGNPGAGGRVGVQVGKADGSVEFIGASVDELSYPEAPAPAEE